MKERGKAITDEKWETQKKLDQKILKLNKKLDQLTIPVKAYVTFEIEAGYLNA